SSGGGAAAAAASSGGGAAAAAASGSGLAVGAATSASLGDVGAGATDPTWVAPEMVAVGGTCCTALPPLLSPWRASALARPHWEATVAATLGLSTITIDDLDATASFGVLASLGHTLGPIRVAAEYSLTPIRHDAWFTFDGDVDREGQIHRIGASARARVGMNLDVMTTALYLELGAGRESIRWRGGGAVSRTDASLGFGWELVGGASRFAGWDVGVRLTAAPTSHAPAKGQALDSTYDLNAMLLLGALLGG
ncbi:MAG: hypothetical protein K8W52_37295, partial [Deltaproteobacteria bacterium]|nr:hypothetical protein [Deltaproteobacteria bacterium]